MILTDTFQRGFIIVSKSYRCLFFYVTYVGTYGARVQSLGAMIFVRTLEVVEPKLLVPTGHITAQGLTGDSGAIRERLIGSRPAEFSGSLTYLGK